MNTALQVAYDVILPILLVAGLGFWVGRRFNPEPRTLSRVAIFLLQPALAFQSSANSTLQPGEIGLIAFFVVTLFVVTWLVAYGLARTQPDLPPATRSAFLLGAMMPNAGNYGLSFVEFAFGAGMLPIAVLVFVTHQILGNTLGIYLASSGTASVRQGILNILKVPIAYATLLGFVVNFTGFQLPVPVARSVGLLSQAAIPIMIILLGIQLARISIRVDLRAQYRALALASSTRLLVTPLLVLLLTALMSISGPTRDVLLVQLSGPTAVYATLLATEFGSDAQFVTATIFITTLASVLTLSIIMALFVG